jgi:hypothetical protein
MPKNFIQKTILSFVFIFGASSQALAQGSVIFIPAKMDYMPIMYATCSPKLICAINKTPTAIENPAFTLIGPPGFVIQDKFQKCPNPLPPDGTCEIYVNFCPDRFGEYQAILKFSGSEEQIFLTGTGHGGGI